MKYIAVRHDLTAFEPSKKSPFPAWENWGYEVILYNTDNANCFSFWLENKVYRTGSNLYYLHSAHRFIRRVSVRYMLGGVSAPPQIYEKKNYFQKPCKIF